MNRYHNTPVIEFHEAFGAPIFDSPTFPEDSRRMLRCALILEEALEFCEASGFRPTVQYPSPGRVKPTIVFSHTQSPPSLIGAAQELADLRYVTDGASLEWGIPLEQCLHEVHRANMSKLGEDGRPIYRADGKILKGPDYIPPQIEALINAHLEKARS